MDERAFPHLADLNAQSKIYCEDMLNEGWPAVGAEHCEGLSEMSH
jgi:hypothetical protein